MCRICNYNQVKDIDRALLSGVSPAALSRRYNFTASELQRHQEHLHQKMALAAKRLHANLHQMLFCKLNIVMEMTLTVIRKTRHNEDPKLFLQAGREFTRIINLMHKMADRLPLDPEFIYCLMASPQWDQQEDALLPYAFPAMSETRQSIKLNLFAPCPEPEPEPVQEPAPGIAVPDSNLKITKSANRTMPRPILRDQPISVRQHRGESVMACCQPTGRRDGTATEAR